MSLFLELKRRNVLRVAAAYVVTAWLLIQVAETIFPLFGFDDTPARTVVIVLAIGFIPALIFAWAFEMTSEGLKKESDVNRSQSTAPHTGKKLDRMIMVVLVLALGYFAFDKFVLDPMRETAKDELVAGQVEEARQQGRTEALVESYGDKTIAVLPFVNMSDDASNEYFSDGVSEELLNLLAKIPELRVISRSSAFSFKGKDIDIPTIAEQLSVAHILEGSVRKAGNQVRITAQLIEARSDTHLWSETYDRTLDDIFAVQDDLAAEIVAQLKVKLLGKAPTSRETNPAAYALFLQARYVSHKGTPQAWQQAIVLYQQALELDSDYSAAWANIATLYGLERFVARRPLPEIFSQARDAARRALEIDPDNASALAILGQIAMLYERDLAVAARYIQNALMLEPVNLDALTQAGWLSLFVGRSNDSIALMKYIVARDPVDASAHLHLAWAHYQAQQLDEALASLTTVARLSPGFLGARFVKGMALLQKGEPEEALTALTEGSPEPQRLIVHSLANYMLGRPAASDIALNVLIEKYQQGSAYNIAYVLAFRGESDRAFAWLDKAIQYHDSGLSRIAVTPWFAKLHEDPRWLPFLESIGSSPAQLDAIEFKVALPK
ncbi:MAG: hypothetical protein DRR06_16065 [Gammaproteobacteria bacterium]|nr:MAG: hypothetical protein DRR06_16065 [Gammaproteobacteria bacterium]